MYKRKLYLIIGTGEQDEMISYTPLWETMKQKEITTYALINKYGFDAHTLNDLKHNKSVTANTLETLCGILNCTPNDVIRFI